VSDLLAIALAVGLLAANAFFVGAEFALVSARRSAVEPLAASGSRAARTTLGAMENVSLMMAGAQLGITICSLGLGAVGEPAVAHLIEGPFHALGMPDSLLHPVAFTLAMTVVVFLHVVVGEMVPKNLALAGPDRAALLLAPPLVLVVRLLRPAIAGLNAIANATLLAVRVQPKNEVTSAFTRDEVAGLVEESRREGLLDAEEHELLTGALLLDERTARSVLLGVDDLETVPPGATARDVERIAARTGYSRFPVRGDDGGLVGYLHLKDVLETDPQARSRPVPSSAVRPLGRVGVDDTLRTILATMRGSRSHLAGVADAEGRVLGIVALEDVLESLVGEIHDESTR
jgi:CBS domain containing-hemolysin-like protein